MRPVHHELLSSLVFLAFEMAALFITHGSILEAAKKLLPPAVEQAADLARAHHRVPILHRWCVMYPSKIRRSHHQQTSVQTILLETAVLPKLIRQLPMRDQPADKAQVSRIQGRQVHLTVSERAPKAR